MRGRLALVRRSIAGPAGRLADGWVARDLSAPENNTRELGHCLVLVRVPKSGCGLSWHVLHKNKECKKGTSMCLLAGLLHGHAKVYFRPW